MKRIKLLGVIALVTITAVIMVACGNGDTINLSAETETRVKQDYVSYYFSQEDGVTAGDITIHKYYGTFNEKIVLSLSTGLGPDVCVTPETIDAFTFYYNYPYYEIRVWDNGDFYTLTQAYEQNLLTYNNVKKIYAKHKKFQNFFYENLPV
jgi:hypothetical protein